MRDDGDGREAARRRFSARRSPTRSTLVRAHAWWRCHSSGSRRPGVITPDDNRHVLRPRFVPGRPRTRRPIRRCRPEPVSAHPSAEPWRSTTRCSARADRSDDPRDARARMTAVTAGRRQGDGSTRPQRNSLDGALEVKKTAVRPQVRETAVQTQDDARVRLEQLQARVSASESSRDKEVENNAAAVRHGDGLVARLTALERISSSSRDCSRHIWPFLFFTATERLPAPFKLLLLLGKPSLYETRRRHRTTGVRRRLSQELAPSTRSRTSTRVPPSRPTSAVRGTRWWLRSRQHTRPGRAETLEAQAVDAWRARQEELLVTDPDRFSVPRGGDGLPHETQDRRELSSAHRAQTLLRPSEPAGAFAP